VTAGPYFNLDDLNGDTFQQLCSAIVLDQFTPIATPYGAPGRDGGVDATHLGVRTDYSQIFDTPIKLESREIYWVFQAKHTKKDRETDRQKAIIKALEKEIFDWLETRWDEREIFPTCFILITNVTVNVSTRNELNELGEIFEYFEVWDGAKVSAFVSANEAIRRTFFQNKDDRCDEMLNTLKTMGSIGVKKVGVVSSTSTKSTSSFDFVVAVEELIDYEILFTTQNNALAEVLNYGDKNWQENADWPLVKVVAKSQGIISLATHKNGLDQVVSQIKLKNMAVFSWSHFVGESIEKGNDIITFKVHPDYVKQVEKMVENIFVVSKGELVAHLQVDSYLLQLQKDILQAFDSRSYVVAERLLGDFYKARSSYLDKKKDHPTASYPNARSFGGRMVFGWDFLTVWETIYEDIVDIILQGKHTQQSVSTVLHMPFSLCTVVITLKGPYQLFHRNFGLVRRLLFILERKNDTGLIKDY